MTGEANLRLSAGRRSGKIGAVVGFFFGCGLILMSILWALVSFGGGGGLDLSARIFAIMLGGGLVIVFTCARNWKRLS
jgi:apolipoprotein N-acyltransferase